MKEDVITNSASVTQTEEALFLERVRQEFHEIKWSTCRYVTQGWDHEVLVLDEKIILRTPKDKRNAVKIQDEIRLLNYLNGKVRAGIPHYEYISADGTIAGYKMLPGRELRAQVFQALADDEKEIIAEALADLFTVLHSTPGTLIEQLNTREEDQRADFAELKRNVGQYLQPRLNGSELDVIAEYFVELQITLDDGYQRVLTHSDLSGDHILWNEQSRQVSIIDFADRSLSDPAVDFAGLFEYGAEFAGKVFDLYGGKKDNSLLSRAELYFKREALCIMIMALQGFPCTFEDSYKMFRNRFIKDKKNSRKSF